MIRRLAQREAIDCTSAATNMKRPSAEDVADGCDRPCHIRRRTGDLRRIARPVDRRTRGARHHQGLARRAAVPRRDVDRRRNLAVLRRVRARHGGADLPACLRGPQMGRRRLSLLACLEDVDRAGGREGGRDAGGGEPVAPVRGRHGRDAGQSEDHGLLPRTPPDDHRPRQGYPARLGRTDTDDGRGAGRDRPRLGRRRGSGAPRPSLTARDARRQQGGRRRDGRRGGGDRHAVARPGSAPLRGIRGSAACRRLPRRGWTC